jgi:colanic acid biosynthesis glycosyl transferase WcaI
MPERYAPGGPAPDAGRAPSVAIVSINYAPERTGIAVYSTGLAEHLRAAGWSVRVHTAFPYYPSWTKRPEDAGRWFTRERVGDVEVHRSWLYVPRRPSALRRMVHEATFAFGALVAYLVQPRADVTVVVSPPLPIGVPLLVVARLKGSRTVFHVQDLQPDAAIDLGMLKPGALSGLLFAIERQTYRLADRVSSISHAMVARIRAKGVPSSKLVLFRNWAQDRTILPRDRDTPLRREWGLDDRFVVLYSGNLGRKQGLDLLLDAAALLREDPTVAIVVVGDGGEREALVARAGREGLSNVVFKPLQPLERLSELLATADVSVIPQKAGVTDIVLPSKLGNIMASARPVIVSADPASELAQVIRAADAGVVVPQGSASAIVEAVLALRANPRETARIGRSARAWMQAHLGERAILRDFESVLRGLVGGTPGDAHGPDVQTSTTRQSDARATES